MKMFKILYKKNDGMTLIETIIGILLISIASLMLLTGFFTAASLIKDATDLKTNDSSVSGKIDLNQGTNHSTDSTDIYKNLAIPIMTEENGTQIKLNGYYQYKTESISSKNAVLHFEFIPTGLG